jgi:hypothetical protein
LPAAVLLLGIDQQGREVWRKKLPGKSQVILRLSVFFPQIRLPAPIQDLPTLNTGALANGCPFGR